MSTTTTAHPEGPPLIPVRATGWRWGLRNLLRKEMGQWWTTRMWWVQTLLWVLLLNGITTAVMLDTGGMTGDEVLRETVQTFLLVAATAVGIGVVLTIQGAVVGEKEMGTAAWVMSKPASRASFVLAKLIAHSVGFLATAIVVPSVVFLVEARFLMSAPIDYGSFGIGVAVVALSVVFYVILTIALGTMFKGRGPVAGIAIGFILAGQFFKGMLPLPLVVATPWLLGDVASSFAIGTQPDFNRTTPIIATVIASVVLAGLALWRFEREEF
jgi:ABC-2 type transport system permease protein